MPNVDVKVAAIYRDKKYIIPNGDTPILPEDDVFFIATEENMRFMSELKKSFPAYTISKNKLELDPSVNIDSVLEKMSDKYKSVTQNKVDGLKLDFEIAGVNLTAHWNSSLSFGNFSMKTLTLVCKS